MISPIAATNIQLGTVLRVEKAGRAPLILHRTEAAGQFRDWSVVRFRGCNRRIHYRDILIGVLRQELRRASTYAVIAPMRPPMNTQRPFH